MKITKDNIELIETRTHHLPNIELRKENNKMTISGYGIVFDSLSEDLGNFKEIIHKRALDEVDLTDVMLLGQHDHSKVLGSTKGNTMSLQVTDKGLYFTAELPDTTDGRDFYTLLERGDLDKCSFGFTTKEESWNIKTNPQTRTVTKIGKLDEISIVNRPAYKSSSVTLRTAEKCKDLKNCMTPKPNPLLEQAKAILEQV